ncbi:hypothetical protein WISP_00178 [Willisornis vidua]|uniref:Growth hormone n=1 Tax=Willisornis vidua TaxID=1566151 RepID=A0ABQ9CJK4_9PASS|nr:hypothetical protein WISP_00178 [Willisornis vidua]
MSRTAPELRDASAVPAQGLSLPWCCCHTVGDTNPGPLTFLPTWAHLGSHSAVITSTPSAFPSFPAWSTQRIVVGLTPRPLPPPPAPLHPPQELEDRSPRGPQILKPTYEKFDIHLRSEDALLQNYSLLSCFKKDLHKVETYLKVLKCRRYGEGNCTV